MSFNVLEIRNYTIKPHLRDHFISYFEDNFIQTLEAANMRILGQFRLIGEPDHYVWLRGYPNMQSRYDSLHGFYDGPVWKKHRTITNSMIVDSDNVHLLRPLDDSFDLTCGQTAKKIAAAIADSTVSLQTGLIAIDIYQGDRRAIIAGFQAQIAPAYQDAGIQLRGCYVAEMGENTFPRHPAFQNADEFVVITAHADEAAGRKQRTKLAPVIEKVLGQHLSSPAESLLLLPTLRSPLRYQQA